MGLEDSLTPERQDIAPKNTPAEIKKAVSYSKRMASVITKLYSKAKKTGSYYKVLKIKTANGNVILYMQSPYDVKVAKGNVDSLMFSYEGSYFKLIKIPARNLNPSATTGSKKIFEHTGTGKVSGIAKSYSSAAKTFLQLVSTIGVTP